MSAATIAHAHGRRETSLTQTVLPLLVADAKPTFVWCEPRPTRTRLSLRHNVEGDAYELAVPGSNDERALCRFQGLWRRDFRTLQEFLQHDVAVEELRMFWDNGTLHLLADGSRTRWAAFWEEADIPAWLTPWQPDKKQFDPAPMKMDGYCVHTLHDFARYGLPVDHSEKVTIVEYRLGTQLIFWNMLEAQT